MADLLRIFGLTWQSFLVSLASLMVLIAGLYLLLFRPLRKIVRQRREQSEEVFRENERLNREVLEIKQKYADMTEAASRQIEEVMRETQRAAAEKAQKIEQGARERAQDYIQNVRKDLDAERHRLEEHFKAEIVDISVEIAGKVLEREVKPEDTKKLVDECLQKWS